MTVTIAGLDELRRKHGCDSDARGTQPFAAAWSKRLIEGRINDRLPNGLLPLPQMADTAPRHAPLLAILRRKYTDRGFSWSTKEVARNGRVQVMVVFSNYPGVNNGCMLTLADLLLLPPDDVDKYVEALRKVGKAASRKTKRRKGAGRYSPGFVEGARCGGWQ